LPGRGDGCEASAVVDTEGRIMTRIASKRAADLDLVTINKSARRIWGSVDVGSWKGSVNTGIYGLRCYRRHPSDLDEELLADGFEPVSAAGFWKFRFRRANVSQLPNRILAWATAFGAGEAARRRSRPLGAR